MVDVHRHVGFVGGIYMETNGTCGDFNRVSSFFFERFLDKSPIVLFSIL